VTAWLDCAGPPGSGKSTLCDPLYGPHAITIENRLPPASWLDFCNECTRLFHLIKPHATFGAALRMVNRSVRKMATVARMEGQSPYIQTGLVQRGLGFGWRLNDMGKDLNELRHYFELMPVSIGVAFTKCPQHIVEERNAARRLVRETRFEDRSRMVGLMMPAIEIAKKVLNERGVPVIEIDTTQPIEDARAQLLAFANRPPCEPARTSIDCRTEILSPPPWWQ
jgi:hypothetical protein